MRVTPRKSGEMEAEQIPADWDELVALCTRVPELEADRGWEHGDHHVLVRLADWRGRHPTGRPGQWVVIYDNLPVTAYGRTVAIWDDETFHEAYIEMPATRVKVMADGEWLPIGALPEDWARQLVRNAELSDAIGRIREVLDALPPEGGDHATEA